MKVSGTEQTQRNQQRSQGFTLVEMLLVLVILAALAAVVVPKFAGRSKQAKVTAAKTEIATLETALDSFEVDNGYYPKGGGGLADLVIQPSNAPDWRGPYIKRGVPKDPWGNDYIYEYPGRRNTGGYDLSSYGPDGRAGGDDDITNWNQTK
ncbi:MAG: Type II secretion system protein G [Verrucomicrobia subdivision 3 bacterium]|nr:Type II secretion system protein G [Limisphaerales bacterium]MCS1412509.1 Type II secretion system protein G [Limisphaerales bacterium]